MEGVKEGSRKARSTGLKGEPACAVQSCASAAQTRCNGGTVAMRAHLRGQHRESRGELHARRLVIDERGACDGRARERVRVRKTGLRSMSGRMGRMHDSYDLRRGWSVGV
eukprot:5872319-Pleurochrysis_carterae.AAC.1